MTTEAVHLDIGELRILLDDPGATPPGGSETPVLVVDLDAAPTDTRPHGAPAGLHAIVVALGADDAMRPPWADLVLPRADVAARDRVLETVGRNPVASLTLVELLRVADGLDLDAGLLAESTSYGVLQAGREFAEWRRRRARIATGATAARAADRSGVHTGDRDAPLLVRREDDELHLRLHRPARRNALDVTLRDALVEQLQLVRSDPSITAVGIDGAGPDFCSGGDLDEFGTAEDASLAHLVRMERSIGRALAAVADRITVRLHGSCIGSGIELAAFSSTVEVHGAVSIGLPELAMGLIPGAGGTVSLPRRIGRHRTCRLALTGERLDGPTAQDWGLVDTIDPGPAGD